MGGGMENLVILLALFVTIGIPIIKCVYDNKKNAEIQELEKIKWETIRNHRKAYEEFSNHLVEVFNELCGIEVEKGIIGFQGGSFLRNLCDRNIVPIYSNPEIVFYYSYAITIYLYFGIEQYLTRNEIKFKRDKVLEGLSILCKNMLS